MKANPPQVLLASGFDSTDQEHDGKDVHSKFFPGFPQARVF